MNAVPVWIFGDEYECPEHYRWSEGPLASPSYDGYRFWISQEKLERWKDIQAAFEAMNQQMKALIFEKARKAREERAAKGVPW